MIVLKSAKKGRNFEIMLRLEAQIVNLTYLLSLRDKRYVIKLIVKVIEILTGYLVTTDYIIMSNIHMSNTIKTALVILYKNRIYRI